MASLSLGIVGLPNVGKSTLFNALIKGNAAEASNYPFCTIDPNVGIVEVADPRLAELASIVNPKQILPAAIEFYDIAGIIKGASQGEGLGNQFLSHIRQTAAILLVARFFDNPDVIHVTGSVDPRRDLETVITELILADLETVAKSRDRYAKQARGGDKVATAQLSYVTSLEDALSDGKIASSFPARNEDEVKALQEMQLLTAKPMLVLANIGEGQIGVSNDHLFDQYNLAGIVPSSEWIIPISAKIEAELAQLDPDDQAEFLATYGLTEPGLHSLTRACYNLLGLQTYFTAGPKEVRAWTIPIGATAPQAAGVIHTDFEKGFIRAEVIAYDDYVTYRGESGAKEAGRLRLEGKEYVVHEGDVMHFRFNV